MKKILITFALIALSTFAFALFVHAEKYPSDLSGRSIISVTIKDSSTSESESSTSESESRSNESSTSESERNSKESSQRSNETQETKAAYKKEEPSLPLMSEKANAKLGIYGTVCLVLVLYGVVNQYRVKRK